MQWLGPPRYPTIDGVDAFEAILGKLGNLPCKEVDVRGGRVIIYWLPGIEGLHRCVLKGTKTERLRRGCLICHVKPRASQAYSRIEWSNEGIIFGPPRKKIDCSTGPRKSVILKIGPD
jgi:hypothetical protein